MAKPKPTVEPRFMLLDPGAFKTAGDVKAFSESDAFDAMLAALSAVSAPAPDEPPEVLWSAARSKAWMLSADLLEVRRIASKPASTQLASAPRSMDDHERSETLALFAVMVALDEEPWAALELWRLIDARGTRARRAA